MLFSTLHVPEVYRHLPRSHNHRDAYCALVTLILLDALRNCEVLVDQHGLIYRAIYDGIQKWPEKHKKRATELVLTLHSTQRFVEFPPDDSPSDLVSCGKPLCRSAFTIALDPSSRLNLVLTVPGCGACAALPKAIDVNGYSSSHFSVERFAKEDVLLNPGDWKKERFEMEIWEPVFRHAKWVKLCDRYPGSNLRRQDGHIILSPRWQASLDWIVDQIKLHSCQLLAPEIDIYCEYKRQKEISYDDAQNGLEVWAQNKKNSTGLTIRMHLHDPTNSRRLNHCRLLVTDQITLLVERGFDLLTESKDEIEDVIITALNPSSTMEAGKKNVRIFLDQILYGM